MTGEDGALVPSPGPHYFTLLNIIELVMWGVR